MEIQHESIFVSALRGFCRSLFVLLGIFAAIFIAIIVLSALSSPYQVEEKTTLTLLPDLDGKRAIAPIHSPAILQINIRGVIGEPERLDTDALQAVLLDSQEGLLQNRRVKGILLYFDTPGGTVIDSDNIYRMLVSYKKKYGIPVFGYVNGLCASGGMYIASAADRIYCSPSGIVGSVGVIFGPFFNISDAIGRIGIEGRTLSAGLDKDAMSPIRPWKPDEDAALKNLLNYFYHQFVDIVVAARPRLDREKLVGEYGAKIFDGPTASQLGYVDEADVEYETALAALLKAAQIDSQQPYQVVQLLPKRKIWADLINGRSPLICGQIEHQLQIGPSQSAFLKDQFAYLYQPNG
jgi:protease-4